MDDQSHLSKIQKLDRADLSSDLPSIPRGLALADEMFALSKVERIPFCILLSIVTVFLAMDLIEDFRGGSSLLHITADIMLGVGAIVGIIMIWARFGKAKLKLSYDLAQSEHARAQASSQAAQWQMQAIQFRDGLSAEIDRRMEEWRLSEAEKEIGLLLMKGLSLKEVAQIRGTAERTVRHQSLAIYSKAGVTGRAELSAFFLEDFLDRRGSNKETPLRVFSDVNSRSISGDRLN